MIYRGFLSHGGTPKSSSIFQAYFPWNKHDPFWGTPMRIRNPQVIGVFTNLYLAAPWDIFDRLKHGHLVGIFLGTFLGFTGKKSCAKTGISCPSWGSSDCTSTGLNRGPLASEKPCFSSLWLLQPGSSYWSQLGMAKILVKRQVRQFFTFQFYQLDVRLHHIHQKSSSMKTGHFSMLRLLRCLLPLALLADRAPEPGTSPQVMGVPRVIIHWWHFPDIYHPLTSGFRLLSSQWYKLQRSWVCQFFRLTPGDFL